MPQVAEQKLPPDANPVGDERPIKILHLSDLHFGATFDRSLWDYVAKVLAGSDKPSIIVVSGDLVDSPSFFMLALARNELQTLRRQWCSPEAPECELIVIPGNHDVGILGNVAIWPWSSKFRIVFSDTYQQLFDRLPTYTDYASKRWYARWAQRSFWTLTFLVRRVFLQLKQPPKKPMLKESAGGAVCFVCFDSNDKLWLASGSIAASDISRAHGELLHRRLPDDTGMLLNLVPRIALVHHHVIAIPYSSVVESLTDFEPFLTLRNAGTLLRELCYWDFDLVLHGHKHLLNFVRLTFDSADQNGSEVAVLAAGSATKGQTISGQNSFNLIKVYRSGTISFRSVRYGQGASGEVDGPWSSGFQRLLPLPEIKHRSHSRARAGQEICCDSLEYGYKVNESGSADCEHTVRGLRGLHEERLRRRFLRFSVSYGAIAGKSIRLNQESVMAGHVLSDVPTTACTATKFQVLLTGQRVAADVGTDFGVTWRMINSFATSEWECLAMGQDDARDWISVKVRFPAKRLRLTVDLPKVFRDARPQLLVRRCPEYPLMKVDRHGDIVARDDSIDWDIDADLTDLEKSNVRALSENRCSVDIEYPLVGHRYELRWRVDTEVTASSTRRRGLALQIRQSLLALACPGDDQTTKLTAGANELLQKVTDHLMKPLIGSTYSFTEELDCALFVYDGGTKSFKLIAEGRTHEGGPSIVREIPLNAGISGAAFKHRGVSLYICPECAGPDGDGAYVYYSEDAPADKRPDYAALLAIPLHLGDLIAHEDKEPPAKADVPIAPEEAIGIFTIATNARDNKLLSLAKTPGSSPNGQFEELMPEIWAVAVQYARAMGELVRIAATSY